MRRAAHEPSPVDVPTAETRRILLVEWSDPADRSGRQLDALLDERRELVYTCHRAALIGQCAQRRGQHDRKQEDAEKGML